MLFLREETEVPVSVPNKQNMCNTYCIMRHVVKCGVKHTSGNVHKMWNVRYGAHISV